MNFDNLKVTLVEIEDDDDFEMPPYGKSDWLIVDVVHTDSKYTPLSVEEYFYGGDGSCFWINDEIGFDCWINMHFSKQDMTEGYWLIENITATYFRGDGWEIDDDVEYEFDEPRKLDKPYETMELMERKYSET